LPKAAAAENTSSGGPNGGYGYLRIWGIAKAQKSYLCQFAKLSGKRKTQLQGFPETNGKTARNSPKINSNLSGVGETRT